MRPIGGADTRRSVPLLSAIAAAGVAVAVQLGGCSADGSARLTVSKDSLESTAKDNLRAAVGPTSQGVECAGPIAGRVGATQRCVLIAEDGSTTDVTATVESVNGESVNVTFDVHDSPDG
jgi:Domain of unknown function (DUF4333)